MKMRNSCEKVVEKVLLDDENGNEILAVDDSKSETRIELNWEENERMMIEGRDPPNRFEGSCFEVRFLEFRRTGEQ